MNDMTAGTPDWVWQTIGWALLHFVWQGTVISLGLAVLLTCMRYSSAKLRYGVSCASMALCAFAPIVTVTVLTVHQADARSGIPLGLEAATAKPKVVISSALDDPAPVADAGAWRAMDGWQRRVQLALPMVVLLWGAGVCFLSVRLVGSWRQMRFITATGGAVEDGWQKRFIDLAARMGISRPVRLARSAAIDIPVMLGFFKPIVLLPACRMNGLTPEQLEAVLAHELAHVQRYDYLVNIAQCVVETALFYHPAIWWISGRVREERENCCDDAAVAACGDRLNYARALATLEELRSVETQLILAADGGNLLRRVRRLLEGDNRRAGAAGWVSLLFCLILMAILAVGNGAGISAAESAPKASTPANPVRAHQAPHVVLQARFTEIGLADFDALGMDWLFKDMAAADRQPGQTLQTSPLGILTDPQLRVLLRALEKHPGVDILSAPRITTLSGRQAQVQAVEIKSVVAGSRGLPSQLSNRIAQSPGGVEAGDGVVQVSLGPSLDIRASLTTTEGIALTATPELVEFLGYASEELANPQPLFRIRRQEAEAVIQNGETVVLDVPTRWTNSTLPAPKTRLIVLLTVRVMDPSGKQKE